MAFLMGMATSAALLLGASVAINAQDTASAKDTGIIQASAMSPNFDKRLKDYVRLRNQVEEKLPLSKSGNSAAALKLHQQAEGKAIRAERSSAKIGDIFTPAVGEELKNLIARALRGSQGSEVEASLRHADPINRLKLEINQAYPQTVALQSTPPSLLLVLPKLPAGLEYRIVGKKLILLDAKADLVVDILPDALPPTESERSGK